MKNLTVLSLSFLLLIISCQDASKKIKDTKDVWINDDTKQTNETTNK